MSLCPHSAALGRVVVAISTFRTDAQVKSLLAHIFAGGRDDFAAVIVVDSLGDGQLGKDIATAGWRVEYVNADQNLGSAGNLQHRLELAARHDADWCFAINHDGMFDRNVIATLVATGRHEKRVGAVFPRRIWTSRGHSALQPMKSVFEMPSMQRDVEPAGPSEVAWDSSNGALYALAPVRAGLRVWGDLWMGWEDLAYGWQLSDQGWRQIVCPDAEFLDDYEYQKIRIFGRDRYITQKPAWYAYYMTRNLVLIVKRTGGGLRGWWFITRRIFREMLFTLLVRPQKVRRLRMLLSGFVDGVRGRTGKAAFP